MVKSITFRVREDSNKDEAFSCAEVVVERESGAFSIGDRQSPALVTNQRQCQSRNVAYVISSLTSAHLRVIDSKALRQRRAHSVR
jgi:hypothetical protein